MLVKKRTRENGISAMSLFIEYGIFGEGSQICRYCLRRKGHKSQLLAGEGSQISIFLTQNFWREKGLKSRKLAGEGSQMKILPP